MTLNKQTFVEHVLRWYQRHGRKNLPWQPFSHFHLDIKPILLLAKSSGRCVMEDNGRVWYKIGQPLGGLSAPVEQLLKSVIGQLRNLGACRT